jgi:hypothetical protein
LAWTSFFLNQPVQDIHSVAALQTPVKPELSTDAADAKGLSLESPPRIEIQPRLPSAPTSHQEAPKGGGVEESTPSREERVAAAEVELNDSGNTSLTADEYLDVYDRLTLAAAKAAATAVKNGRGVGYRYPEYIAASMTAKKLTTAAACAACAAAIQGPEAMATITAHVNGNTPARERRVSRRASVAIEQAVFAAVAEAAEEVEPDVKALVTDMTSTMVEATLVELNETDDENECIVDQQTSTTLNGLGLIIAEDADDVTTDAAPATDRTTESVGEANQAAAGGAEVNVTEQRTETEGGDDDEELDQYVEVQENLVIDTPTFTAVAESTVARPKSAARPVIKMQLVQSDVVEEQQEAVLAAKVPEVVSQSSSEQEEKQSATEQEGRQPLPTRVKLKPTIKIAHRDAPKKLVGQVRQTMQLGETNRITVVKAKPRSSSRERGRSKVKVTIRASKYSNTLLSDQEGADAPQKASANNLQEVAAAADASLPIRTTAALPVAPEVPFEVCVEVAAAAVNPTGVQPAQPLPARHKRIHKGLYLHNGISKQWDGRASGRFKCGSHFNRRFDQCPTCSTLCAEHREAIIHCEKCQEGLKSLCQNHASIRAECGECRPAVDLGEKPK